MGKFILGEEIKKDNLDWEQVQIHHIVIIINVIIAIITIINITLSISSTTLSSSVSNSITANFFSDDRDDRDVPCLVPNLENICAVRCGARHSIVLDGTFLLFVYFIRFFKLFFLINII